jgi:hypothetical protein
MTNMRTFALIAFSVLLIFPSNQVFAAVDMTSRELQTFEGNVGKFLEPGLFWLTGVDAAQILVYSNVRATVSLHSGQKVRVTGSAPLDWSRLADQELNARTITPL